MAKGCCEQVADEVYTCADSCSRFVNKPCLAVNISHDACPMKDHVHQDDDEQRSALKGNGVYVLTI
jgi:hypothetical protein